MGDTVISFSDSAAKLSTEHQRVLDDKIRLEKWNFLCFLGNIKDGDSSLEHLFAMAHDCAEAYDRLGLNKKDILFWDGYVDRNHGLLPHFQEIARNCIIQETTPLHQYRLDFTVYRPLISFMQGECGTEDFSPETP